MSRNALFALLVLIAAVAGGLLLLKEPGGETPGEDLPPVVLPEAVEVPDPDRPLRDLELVENHSEDVANEMLGFADKLRRRDFRAAEGWLTREFAGHALAGLAVAEEDALPLDAKQTAYDPSTATVVGRADFVASLAERIGPWKRVEHVLWKVKNAEFQTGRSIWGKVRYKVTILGTDADGGPRSITAWGHGRMVKRDGQWRLDRFALVSLSILERAEYLFTDVSTSAGVAHTGIRFGKPGNQSFAWNGAALGDADGDGLYDLFVPSLPKNFLYVARPQGGFADEADARGLATPAGGTGAVFFDFDNDGDQDLALADVGWREADGTFGGNRLRLYRNDGAGRFDEVGREVGFDALCYGYTLVVLDYDLDGWLDVYVCNYGLVAKEPNNSWTDATNGMSSMLLRNDGGERFVDVTAEAGVTDDRWTYAAAAADFDLDGDQDIYVANDYGTNHLWRNEGDGTFVDAAAELGVADLGNGMGAAWGDLSGDGVPDLYNANMSSTAGNRILSRLEVQEGAAAALKKMAAGNTIFLARATPGGNGGGPDFEVLPSQAGGIGASWAWSPALFDFDLDGCLDVFCANGFITGDTAADT